MIEMKVKKVFKDAKLPVRERDTDSGADIFVYRFEKMFTTSGTLNERMLKGNESILQIKQSVILDSLDRILVHTGISATVGPGYEIQVRPRSGNAINRGLTVLNTPGTIDESYRGVIAVIIINLSTDRQEIKVGEKIAQLVVCPVVYPKIIEVAELDQTNRNDKGFGSSGKF